MKKQPRTLLERVKELRANIREHMKAYRQVLLQDLSHDPESRAAEIQAVDDALRLLEGDTMELREVEAALRRFRAGRYGECEQCGNRIKAKRLRAMPFATQCRDCQEETEAIQLHERQRLALAPSS